MVQIWMGGDHHGQSLWVQIELVHIGENRVSGCFSNSAVDKKDTLSDQQVLKQESTVFVDGTDLVGAWIKLHGDWNRTGLSIGRQSVSMIQNIVPKLSRNHGALFGAI